MRSKYCLAFSLLIASALSPASAASLQDGFANYLLVNPVNRNTAIWAFQGNTWVSGGTGPTLPAGWGVACVADMNLDGRPDYVLFNASSRQTAVWFMNNASLTGTAFGPTIPAGWTLIAAADLNHDGQPDFVLFHAGTGQTAIWFLSGTTYIGGVFGPVLPPGWSLEGVSDFNHDGQPDYLLFNSATRQTAVWYLHGTSFSGGTCGPTLPAGWTLGGAADFNGDGNPDYILFSASTRRTALWYLNGTALVSGAWGAALPPAHPAGSANGLSLSQVYQTTSVRSASSESVSRYGVFSLLDPGSRVDPGVLANSYVNGISIRQEWCDLNPANGVFDFSYLDTQITQAAAAGKKVLLRIVDGGVHIPAWVLAGASTTYTFSANQLGQPRSTITVPVLWDSFYVAKKEAMLTALGARYASNPAVTIVSVGINNTVTNDWYIPHGSVADAPFSTSEVARWDAAGYSPAKIISAAGEIIDTAMAAFPNQTIGMAVSCNDSVIDAPNQGDYEARMIVANARTKWGATKLMAERHNLCTQTPTIVPPLPTPWRVFYDSAPAVGAQMLWNSFGDAAYRDNGGVAADPATILRQSIDIGVAYGIKYIEIYQTDVINLPAVIAYAESVLP